MRIQIRGRTNARWRDLVLLCETSIGRESARLHRALSPEPSWSRVFRYASALFPRGRLSVRLWNRRTGKVVAATSHDCKKSHERVVLDL